MEVNGDDIIELGIPEGLLVGKALAVARHDSSRTRKDAVLQAIHQIFEKPESFTDISETTERPVPNRKWADAVADFATAIVDKRNREQFRQSLAPLDAPIEHVTIGDDLITEATIRQMRGAMRLPVTVGGALMPDAHPIQPERYPDYNLPVGGVWALDGAISPHAVGYDIGCSMMLSVFPIPEPTSYINDRQSQLRRELMEKTAFGRGSGFDPSDRRTHEIMDDPRWDHLPSHLTGMAASQLGSSGGSNHFVEWGVLTLQAALPTQYGALDPGTYLALLSHSGSRGIGPHICNHYKDMAMEQCWGLPDDAQHLAWLDMDGDGENYYRDMKLAGDWARANHEVIHEHVPKALDLRPVAQVFNAHNLAEQEMHDRQELIVHRKGATPAHDGQLGIIPGSMGEQAALVQGKGCAATHDSASHGAGRTMSRAEAKDTLSREDEQQWLARRGVDLLEGGLDDHPGAYKDIDAVLDLQADIVQIYGRFQPRIVRMAHQ